MTITYELNQPANVVFDHLSDMQKFAAVHPVITRIEQKGPQDYLVYETLRVLFIPFSFTYPVAIEADGASGRIKMDSTVKRMAKIDISFAISQANGKTKVEETLVLTTRLPIKR